MKNQLTRIELAHLCGTVASDLCLAFRDRHISALARSWVRINIPLLRKLRALAKEVEA